MIHPHVKPVAVNLAYRLHHFADDTCLTNVLHRKREAVGVSGFRLRQICSYVHLPMTYVCVCFLVDND